MLASARTTQYCNVGPNKHRNNQTDKRTPATAPAPAEGVEQQQQLQQQQQQQLLGYAAFVPHMSPGDHFTAYQHFAEECATQHCGSHW